LKSDAKKNKNIEKIKSGTQELTIKFLVVLQHLKKESDEEFKEYSFDFIKASK